MTTKKKSKFTPDRFAKVLTEAEKKNDQQLYDALVIARHTGCRPAELARGIRMEANDDTVAVYIKGAKKSGGDPEAKTSAGKAKKGRDRMFTVRSPQLADVSQRNEGYFVVRNYQNLQNRLYRMRERTGNDLSFSSLRNQFAIEVRTSKVDGDEINYILGYTK